MKPYHKIQTIYFRDPDNHNKTLLEGQFSTPEFEYLQNNIWRYDEKVDGTCIRIILENEQLIIKGKQEKSDMPKFLFAKLNDIFLPKLKQLNEIFGKTNICMYGEGFGSRLQKGGGNYRRDQGFVLFDIKIGNWWLKREDIEKIAKKLDIEIIPTIGEGTLHDMVKRVKNGFNSTWGDFIAEGIVARPKVELTNRAGKRVITKLKYKDFVHIH